ncbi:MAG: SurA N-terminal domain-containing protein [Nitrospirota bacterium]|nr:SurA N-terminal domain-containing protein [Nitrospirota bacterium]
MMVVYAEIRKLEGLYAISRSLFFAVLMVLLFVPSALAATLARVNQTPIEAREINARVQVYLRQIGHKRLSPLRMASLEKEVLKKAIEEELLYQEALNNDLSVSAVEITAGLKKNSRTFSIRAGLS